ncbi:MAG TPA: hypothetical protein VF937_01965, partial [Chloroflexota bacterium]
SANADPTTPYSTYCTESYACSGAGWIGVGGTSAATPLWAGLTADINQNLASQGKSGIGGDAHTTLYGLFNTTQSSPPYHDITSGNNEYYPATAAYDMASGIGSLDACNIARDIAGVGSGLIATLCSPQRLVDTRTSGGPISAGTSRCFQVAGRAGIPSDASAVVLNLAAVGQTSNGWLTVYPAGQAVPATSTLNFGTSQYAVANGAIMRIGSSGQVCVNVGTAGSVSGSSQAILDATGYLSATALAQLPMLASPQRLIDTRASGGPIATGTSRCFQVAGIDGIPTDASAVVLNVTAAGYGVPGWLTVYPAGQTVPTTSTVNFDTTEYAMANNALMRIGAGGQVCVNVGTVSSAPGSSQVILDATGYVTSAAAGQLPTLTSPQRLVDTRSSGGPLATGTSRCFTVAGQVGVPSNATGVLLNVTAVGYGTDGWLTAYPAGGAVPATSTVNFDTSEYALANGAIIQLGSGGQVCVNVGTLSSASGSSQVILDVVGYLVPVP